MDDSCPSNAFPDEQSTCTILRAVKEIPFSAGELKQSRGMIHTRLMMSCFLEGLLIKHRYQEEERRLVRRILNGNTYAQIAKSELMSESKVKKMAVRIYRRAGFKDRDTFERALQWTLMRCENECDIEMCPKLFEILTSKDAEASEDPHIV